MLLRSYDRKILIENPKIIKVEIGNPVYSDTFNGNIVADEIVVFSCSDDRKETVTTILNSILQDYYDVYNKGGSHFDFSTYHY